MSWSGERQRHAMSARGIITNISPIPRHSSNLNLDHKKRYYVRLEINWSKQDIMSGNAEELDEAFTEIHLSNDGTNWNLEVQAENWYEPYVGYLPEGAIANLVDEIEANFYGKVTKVTLEEI